VLTAVEYEAQIDRMLDETEIALCFDTGHHAFRDQDALAYMDRVFDRIAYMHLKNVDAEVRARVTAGTLRAADAYAAGIMCPLPDGVVDIRKAFAMLEARGFDGPVIVEQDVAENAAESQLELARRNLDYLRGTA
jgi:inosose dehydratase